MTVSELIKRLQKLPSEREVVILDGFNGGGVPRTINFGPLDWVIKSRFPGGGIDERGDTSDIESRKGDTIVVMGYGCY